MLNLWVNAMGIHLSSGALLLTLLVAGCEAPEYEPPQVPPPPPAPAVQAGESAEPSTADAPQAAPPPNAPPPPTAAPPPPADPNAAATPPPAPTAAPQQAPLVYTYPTGQWIWVAERGWVWVPSGTASAEMDGVPYAYLYTPAYGWTWYVSPWGWGPYHYGLWYRHPWNPAGWHGYWVAHPHVVGRFGRGGWHGGGFRGGGFHGGGHGRR